MRVDNLKITLTLPIPVKTPDRNGVVYSEEAVTKAVNSLRKGLPIMYRDNGAISDGVVIGHTVGDAHIVTWDSEQHICKVTVDGVVHFGGIECIVNDIKDGVVNDFDIIGFGLSI